MSWKDNQEPEAQEYGVQIFAQSGSEHFGPLNAEQAKQVVIQNFADAIFIEVSWERGNLSLGAVMVWSNAERAFVRLDEHCEHFATDPQLFYDLGQGSQEFTHPVGNGFKGNSFHEDFHRTITKNQALEAVLHWLGKGEKLKQLHWI